MYPKTDQARLQDACAHANSFDAVANLMLEELGKFPMGAEVGMVFGPITTGGRGSPEKNLRVFSAVISRLIADGNPVFSQMPYEPQLFRLSDAWRASCPENQDAYCWPVLKETYLPLFQSGRITRAWFIPGWEFSTGAKWERETLAQLDARFVDLTPQWIEDALVAV